MSGDMFEPKDWQGPDGMDLETCPCGDCTVYRHEVREDELNRLARLVVDMQLACDKWCEENNITSRSWDKYGALGEVKRKYQSFKAQQGEGSND